MKCHDCEKKNGGAPKFPGAVVEIHNQEKIVFLRKVVIPASLGDDTVVVPEIGKYCNTLLEYEASGSVYLYSSDGIPTKLSTDVGELNKLLEEEAIARKADDEGLRMLITEETAARIASTAEVRDELKDTSDILGARIDLLSSSLSAEAAARQEADSMLSEEVADEAEARQAADETLTQAISNEVTDRGNAINALQTSLNSEISARQTADATLQENIDELPIPTKVSELTNDSNYQTAADVSKAVADAVGGISGFDYQVVAQLPSTGAKGTIYLVSISGTSPNFYAEYIWVDNAWEQIGTTEVDLSGYATTEALNAGLAKKVDTTALASVATSGSYNDLSNKPTIPTTTSQLTNNSDFVSDASYVHTDNNFTTAEKNKLSGIANGAEVNVNADWNATSGDAQILNKPTIPTVNNGTLTIQKNGENVATFAANASTNTTANITAAEIAMTMTDPGEGAALGENEYVAVYGVTMPDADNYSLTEFDTGNTWIDGKPIYKKTINFGALPNTTTKKVAHGVTGLDLVVQTYGFAIRRSDGVRFPLPFLSSTSTGIIPYSVDGTNISLDTYMDRSNTDAFVTIFYTKE